MASARTTTLASELVLRADEQQEATTVEAPGRSPNLSGDRGSHDEYLTHNGSPTGLEPEDNPADWPANHRRVPPFRAPVVNPQWYEIRGDTAGLVLFMWTMLSGCQLMQWGYSVPTSLGLHKRGMMMYKIANEW